MNHTRCQMSWRYKVCEAAETLGARPRTRLQQRAIDFWREAQPSQCIARCEALRCDEPHKVPNVMVLQGVRHCLSSTMRGTGSPLLVLQGRGPAARGSNGKQQANPTSTQKKELPIPN
ncbi:hypothetical protein HAX54_032965 [Datura stramonium]|uniref:Uncharacterized protein n=1 Tax=Datura stramonium TaxID=4076 RepID=A0ABS8VF92_DATST|nr:hypothetical protein [Datura stramonium]